MTRASLYGRLVTGLVVWLLAATAVAQPSAADRAAAAQAYDRGSAAYLARQYERASSMFETAYRVMPNSTALLQAVRAHHRAGHGARAATLAHRLVERFELGPDQAEVDAIVAELTPTLLRVRLDVEGAPSWELDGALQDEGDAVVFCAPGSHAVRVSFATGVVELDASGDAGDEVSLEAVAPEAPAPLDDAARTSLTAPDPLRDDTSDGGLEPWLFVSLASATAVAGGFLLAFGIDAWSGLDSYRDAPTAAGLEDGQGRELRTNVMFGVTGGLALAALITALVTDWDGESAPTPVAVIGEGHLSLGLRGRMP